MRITLFSAAMCLAIWTTGSIAAEPITIELELNGQRIEGSPLLWSGSSVHLLARDGKLFEFHPHQAKNFRKTGAGFRSYSQGEMRAELIREFGRGFDVSGTGHYLVVHPAGQRNKWASRFEDLYRSFVHYFTARGFRPASPQFPLVAVVFPSHADFLRYVNRDGARLPSGALGYYTPVSNRILLYDVTPDADQDDSNWHVNAETIIHEAAHQSAFNTGIHNRYTMPPRWVVEGLGTMFEAPGVWNSRQFPRLSDRINRGQLAAFKRYVAAGRPKGSLAQFVSSDRAFLANIGAFYAEAWALSFYLIETRPSQYIEHLRQTASQPSFTTYGSPQRLREFTRVFGSDLEMLEAHFLRYIANLE